jgi:two-component SAPR family response regulator
MLFAQEEYGLEFASKGMDPDARTGMSLFPDNPFTAEKQFSLAFDISFVPNTGSYFGYIFRLTDEKEQYIDLVYKVRTSSLEVIAGDEYAGISLQIPPSTFISHWQNLRLNIDNMSSGLTLQMNGKIVGKATLHIRPGHKWRISFGVNRYDRSKTFDLPPMRLRDIKLYREDALVHHWPLRQYTGHTDTDIINQQTAEIDHAIWLAHIYRNWQQAGNFITMGNASVAFDKERGTIYICARDTLFSYDCNRDILHTDSLTKPQGLPPGNQSVFGGRHLYNFLADLKKVTTYSGTTHSWDIDLDHDSVTTFWHANRFYAPFDSSIYIIGGYGNYRYTNQVQRYNTDTHQWDLLDTGGDMYTPRYQAALGTTANGDSAYIIGGHGSIKGDQLLNPHNLYDLNLFEARTGTFKKIYELPTPEQQFAFGNSMVIDTREKSYYALTFANDKMESSLQLIKGSLTRPVFSRLAAPIPFRYFDIRSRAELFYYEKAHKLIAVVLYTPENHVTQVRIYTIQFPPSLLVPPVETTSGNAWLLWLATGACLLLAIGMLFGIRRTIPAVSTVQPNRPLLANPAVKAPVRREMPFPPTVSAVAGPAIFLFGQFTVLDKEGNNISKLFSPLVKELFLLLLLHAIPDRKGITSDRINETLWSGRSVKDAKNNRSVNIVKLKNILDKLGNYTLQKESDRWVLYFDTQQVYIDLLQYFELTAGNTNTADTIPDEVALTARGGLLTETEYGWLDKFKSDISSSITTRFLQYLQEQSHKCTPELVIAVANSILNFDALSEEAVMFKCRALVSLKQHASARAIYNSFKKEYETIYGETFEKEYQALLVD